MKALMCMLLRDKGMLVSRQYDAFHRLKPAFLCGNNRHDAPNNRLFAVRLPIVFFYIESFEEPFLGPFFDKIFNKLACWWKPFE